MRNFCTKPILVWVWIIFILSCRPQTPELIQFGVSQGVMNNMDFNPLGIQVGQKLKEIRLHTLQGKSLQLNPSKKRPLLFITGSYTCDVTRSNLGSIDGIYTKYKDVADIYLINTLEAHPQNSQSPYSAEPTPWLTQENLKSGISGEQPRTMEERKEMAAQWIHEQNIQTPVLLDGAQNEFWNLAGQAPNMAILISSEGDVVLKQSWFEEKELEEAIQKQF